MYFCIFPGSTSGVSAQAQISAINFVTIGVYLKPVDCWFHIVIVYVMFCFVSALVAVVSSQVCVCCIVLHGLIARHLQN